MADDELLIQSTPRPEDPMDEALAPGAKPGLLYIDFEIRKRVEVAGEVSAVSSQEFSLDVRRVYAQCPKYIQAGRLQDPPSEWSVASERRGFDELADHREWIQRTDTLFVASAHSETGASISHRGGQPGFVQLRDENTQEWPDYPRNSMFITLGNIHANERCGILVPDFDSRSMLQMTGTERVIRDQGRIRRYPGAERVVEFTLGSGLERTGRSRGWTRRSLLHRMEDDFG